MYQNYLGTILAVYQLIPWSCSHIWFSTCPFGFFFVLVLAEKRISILQYNPSRGHRPIVDTCANEAIPQWGKRRLITFVYLQNMSMVVKQCCGYLPFLSLESCCLEFVWNNHYHELGTERAISLIQVCVCVCVCACACARVCVCVCVHP